MDNFSNSHSLLQYIMTRLTGGPRDEREAVSGVDCGKLVICMFWYLVISSVYDVSFQGNNVVYGHL